MDAPPSSHCLLDLPASPEDDGAGGDVTEEETRDWAELPWDVLLAVLHRLDHIDIVQGPGKVCRPWRRATREAPTLWRRIDMRFHYGLLTHVTLRGLMRAAMARSAGRCEAFWGEGAVGYTVLSILGHGAPSLKSLRLISCDDIVDVDLKQVITKFPNLEELELSNCWHDFPSTLELLGDACPLLRRFRLSQRSFFDWRKDDRPAMAIARMQELRSLQLFANSLTNSGLSAILDGCAHLESIDIRYCYHVSIEDDDMRGKCSRIKTMRLPDASTHDYDLSFNVFMGSSDSSFNFDLEHY